MPWSNRPVCRNYGAPHALEPTFYNKRSHRNEKTQECSN